ncbi:MULTISPECIES: G/U mismatch-specific DNA glycosylase [Streptomycetaceae]|uniref:Putative G/U mismatch-specific DNA glycosylase n=1 Tax=Streptantibioticus cattleyicolor (strain ATCC 35852 / DSM 46488 / JCM 4925 / NBRC 14057 / NRRL 8057) TaxID=1003195 RepID=F8JPQ0_STREN|nr:MULTISPECIES: G/U mismatch-specific DNA glycosylase [Streptomycetaceae]AEW92743.1 putative G/U mismatch-specific DNA glycosylase [Streptantibioticus cattleyicolor NRRL 8057 = DSM 46488]MYS57507.1 G/U mismatch-specific DNA glycosylase [Streptomyces sp. SID5468]CCB73096.1 G/U mismatch-specific DNA glycosylase [Streptantibioticus cattleyicolor NRRL 8057 = DSM 46488]
MTPEELEAARDRTVPDVIADGLRVLFCGINPGLLSAATGHHFARPGNRFWPALHLSGFTPRRLAPAEQHLLLEHGLGITNVAARATARADELTVEELRTGGEILVRTVLRHRPRWLAVAGITAYRTAFGEPGARIGPQERTIGATRIWALPNPSGLNALWTTPKLTDAFRAFRLVTGLPDASCASGPGD